MLSGDQTGQMFLSNKNTNKHNINTNNNNVTSAANDINTIPSKPPQQIDRTHDSHSGIPEHSTSIEAAINSANTTNMVLQTAAITRQARPNSSPTPSIGSASSHAHGVSCKSQLFHSISSYTGYQDCSTLNVAEAIERDCLSVLHKLHDQVNGLQLVQVVVQPLAKLFNPTNLANLVASQSLSINPASHSSGSSTHHQNIAKQVVNVMSAPSSISTYMMTPDTVQALIARLDTDRDVNWLMEIIGYGLSMPFSLTGEQDSVKDCCTIYCEWLTSALVPYQDDNDDSRYKQLSKLLPIPIRDDPNRYARKMLSHLYNIFLPRQNSPLAPSQILSAQEQQQALLTSVSRQAVLCHRVLRTIETIAQNPTNLMENKTWDHLLAFLLTVNDELLSSPTEPDDIGTQLCDRILGVLFELMLLACSRSLPTPSLWKTFHQLSLNWRHRPALIDHWRRITLMLTKKLAQMPEHHNIQKIDGLKHNPNSVSPKISISTVQSTTSNTYQQQSNMTSSIDSVIDEMSYDLVIQAWCRFLNLIGNPVELSNPDIISKTDEFYHYACASDNVVDPRQHPCLNVLPAVFQKSIKGITDFIETFLKTTQHSFDEDDMESIMNKQANQQPRGSILSTTSNNSIIPISAQLSQSSVNNTTSTGSTALNSVLSNSVQSNANQAFSAQTPTNSRKVVHSIKSITSMKSNHKGVPYSSHQSGLVSGTISNSNQTLMQSNVSGQQQSQIVNPSLTGTTNEFHNPVSTNLSSSSQRSAQQHSRSRTIFANNNCHHIESSQLSPNRPKCNTILHIFGDWLFSVALIGSDLDSEVNINDEPTDLVISTPNFSLSGAMFSQQQPSPTTSGQSNASGSGRMFKMGQSPSSSSTVKNSHIITQSNTQQQYPDRVLLEQQLTPDSFEAGQAEAIGILCKLFSSKLSDEDISPVYLARFYLCLQHCLTYSFGEQNGNIKTQILTSVLVNSTSLLQHDLDGINILIPLFIKAIEIVFECYERDSTNVQQPRQQPKSQQQPVITNVPRNTELRRACISMILTLLAYPLHFRSLPIRNCLNETSPTTTFASLRPRLVRLLMIALQTETDPINMQMLFGGLSLSIHDILSSASSISSNLSGQQHQDNQDRSSLNSKSSKPITGSATRADSTNNSFQSLNLSQATKTSISNKSQKSIDNKLSDTLSVSSSTNSTSTEQRTYLSYSTTSQSFIYGSTEGYIIKSLHVVCHLLINVWKHDTQVSLSALELLTSIARLTNAKDILSQEARLNNNDNESTTGSGSSTYINMRQEYKQATKWICDYIGNQCSRPPPAHSKDMHSTIVAAYHCLSVWFYNHPYLLQDQVCVDTVMETIELGVSGQKSKTTLSGVNGVINSVISREEKSMKPSSMRVREAAESLLNSCMVHTRIEFAKRIADNDLSKTIDSDMDERSLVELLVFNRNLNQEKANELINTTDPYKYFKYFSDDNLTILAFMDCLDDPNFKDSVLCLIRSPFGKHCWQFKFKRYSAKSKDRVLANRIPGLVKRPQPHHQQYSSHLLNNNPHSHHHQLARYFPDTLDKLPQIKLDLFVPSLETYLLKPSSLDINLVAANDHVIDESQVQLLEQMHRRMRSDNEKLMKIYNHQILAEQKVQRESSIRMKRIECEEPQPTNDLDAARVIISQLGYAPSLNTLDATYNQQFGPDLKALDRISVQTCDTAHVYYIRKNKVNVLEILESPTKRQYVSKSFFEWLIQLGQAVVVDYHGRWTGKASTSWEKSATLHLCDPPSNKDSNGNAKLAHPISDETTVRNRYLNSDTGGSVFDGERMTLYWSDMTQELAFIMPHKVAELDHSAEDSNLVGGGDHHSLVNEVNVEFRTNLPDNDKLLLRARSRSSTDNHYFATDNVDVRSISSMTSDDASSQTSQSMRMSTSSDHQRSSNQQQQHKQTHHNTSERGFNNASGSMASSRSKKKSANLSANIGCDTTIIICWLECYDDLAKVPTDWLLSIAETGVYYVDQNKSSADNKIIEDPPRLKARDFVKIFICPMKNGLHKINICTSFGKHWLALPLIDGMTVSRTMLADLVRCSVLNSCRRRRLDTDGYQPPHVKRKLKILEISSNYKVASDKSGLHNYLFHPMTLENNNTTSGK